MITFSYKAGFYSSAIITNNIISYSKFSHETMYFSDPVRKLSHIRSRDDGLCYYLSTRPMQAGHYHYLRTLIKYNYKKQIIGDLI